MTSQKTKFVKLWDLSRYSQRTTSKTPTCQKLTLWGKLSLRYYPSYALMIPYKSFQIWLGSKQVGVLDVVLSEYVDKSHNFTNLIFMTSPL